MSEQTKAADELGPRTHTVSKLVCDGCPALKTERWRDYLENDETDSGTSATCTKAGRNISAYWSERQMAPEWCPITTPTKETP